MRWGALVVMVVGCGRVGFDAHDDAPATASCGPTTGLLGYWPMDAVDVAGSTVHDRSGAGRDGLIVAGADPRVPVVAAGQVGEGLDFGATNGAYLQLPALPVATTPGAVTTVALWFRNDTAFLTQALAFFPGADDNTRYDVWLDGTQSATVSLCINGNQNECWGIRDSGLLGRWVHVVAEVENGPETDGVFYVDGVRRMMGCRFGVCDQTRTVLGPFGLASSDPVFAWTGQIDEARIYDRALAADEVQALYACH